MSSNNSKNAHKFQFCAHHTQAISEFCIKTRTTAFARASLEINEVVLIYARKTDVCECKTLRFMLLHVLGG